jgi:hypothetical protein
VAGKQTLTSTPTGVAVMDVQMRGKKELENEKLVTVKGVLDLDQPVEAVKK